MSERPVFFPYARVVGYVLICAWCFFCSLSVVRAAVLTHQQDIVSREDAAALSNHEIHLQSPSGINGAGQTIVLTFASPFTGMSSLTISDLALFHGPVSGFENQDALAASSGVDTWGVGISGQTVTLTAPTNAAPGYITANTFFILQIGTNAGGTHQITNPATAGEYQISINGSFGDTGTLLVPISGNDTVNVSGTIAAPPAPPPGGHDSSPPSSPPPPSIGGISVGAILSSSADISWTTSTATTGVISFGTDPLHLLSTWTESGSGTTHLGHLTGLSPDTTYSFVVRVIDGLGDATLSSESTFHTLPPPHAPVISGVSVSALTPTSATISWTTDEAAAGSIALTPPSSDGPIVSVEALTSHVITVSGLTPATHETGVIFSSDALSGLTSSASVAFDTLPLPVPPNVSDFSASASSSGILLTWTNPVDASFTRVVIVRDVGRYPTGPADGTAVYSGTGERTLDTSALVAGTTYDYTAFSENTVSAHSSGALTSATIRTHAPPTPTSTSTPPLPPVSPPLPPSVPVPAPSVVSPMPVSPTAPSTPTSPGVGGGGAAASTGIPFGVGGSSGAPSSTPRTLSGSDSASSTLPSVLTPTAPETESSSSLAQTVAPSVTTERVPTHLFFVPAELEVLPDAGGAYEIPAGQSVRWEVASADVRSAPCSGELVVGTSQYALALNADGTRWTASFVPTASSRQIAVRLTMQLGDGSTVQNLEKILLEPVGRVSEDQLFGGSLSPLPDAYVTLLDDAGNVLALDAQQNPAITSATGKYLFLVPNGSYTLVVNKNGYREYRRVINVAHGFIAEQVALKANPKPLSAVIDPHASLGQNVLAVVGDASVVVNAGLDVVQAPANQAAVQSVVAPVAVTVTVASSVSAVSAFSALSYVQYLVTSPLLLLGRRKRRKWGTVYHALTKLPIELAIVRLLNADTGALVQTRITDPQGRFSFLAKPGTYRIEVVKPGFVFPSAYLQHETRDVDFVDLYHHETIEVKEAGVISPNVPLDPVGQESEPRKILIKRAIRRVQDGFGLLGVVLTTGALIVSPTPLIAGALLVQVALYLICRRLSLPHAPTSWGVIRDEQTRRPLERSVVRIFDKKFNKLLETQITSKTGSYGFFAGKNVYYVTAEREGYARYQSSDLDLTAQDMNVVQQAIALKKIA